MTDTSTSSNSISRSAEIISESVESTSLLLIESLAKYYTFDELAKLLCQINFHRSRTNQEYYYLPKDIVIEKIIRSYLCVPHVVHENVRVTACSSHDGRYPLEAVVEDNDGRTWWLSADDTMPSGMGKEYLEFQLVPNPYSNQQKTTSSKNDTTKDDTKAKESDTRAIIPQNTENDPHKDPQRIPSSYCQCRLNKISLKIPPLPHGPLSVALFHLERRHPKVLRNSTTYESDDYDWIKCTPTYRVDPTEADWQEFVIDNELDVDMIRLVCTANQISLLSLPAGTRQNYYHYYSSIGLYCVRFD